MTGRLFALAALAGVGLALAAGCRQEPAAPEAAATPAAPAGEPSPLFTGGANLMDVNLFFVSADGEFLAPERRSIFRTATVNDRARQTLQALFEGPRTGLLPSVPPGTTLLEIFIARDGIAYVDVSPEFLGGIEIGSSDAVYAVFSIVDTLSENFAEIQKVKILIDGDEVESVGGHLDLSRPILPEMGFVSAAPPGSAALAAPRGPGPAAASVAEPAASAPRAPSPEESSGPPPSPRPRGTP